MKEEQNIVNNKVFIVVLRNKAIAGNVAPAPSS